MINFADPKAMKAYVTKAAKTEAAKRAKLVAADKERSAKIAADRATYMTAKSGMTDIKVGQVICKL